MANDYVAVQKVTLSPVETMSNEDVGLAFSALLLWANGRVEEARELVDDTGEAYVLYKMMRGYAGLKQAEYKKRQETNRNNSKQRWEKERAEEAELKAFREAASYEASN